MANGTPTSESDTGLQRASQTATAVEEYLDEARVPRLTAIREWPLNSPMPVTGFAADNDTRLAPLHGEVAVIEGTREADARAAENGMGC